MKNYIYMTLALMMFAFQSLLAQDVSFTNAKLQKPAAGQSYGQACFTLIAEEGVSVTDVPLVVEVSMSKLQFDVTSISGFNSNRFSWSVDAFADNVIRGTLIHEITDVDNGGGGAEICIPAKRATADEYNDSRNGYVVNVVPGSLDQGGNSGSDYTSRFGFSNSSNASKSDLNELAKSNDNAVVMMTEDVNVFPNPSSEFMRVTMVLDDNADYSISIFDINGKSMIQNDSFEGHSAINVQNWTPGMYIMQVQNKQSGVVSVKRVMVAE